MGNTVKELGQYEGIGYRQVRTMMTSRGWTLEKLAEELGKAFPEAETTPNNLANKLYRGTIRFCDMERIAEVMGYSYFAQPYRKDTGSITDKTPSSSSMQETGRGHEWDTVMERLDSLDKTIKELRRSIDRLSSAGRMTEEAADPDKKKLLSN